MRKSRITALFLVLTMLLCTLPVSAAEGDWLIPKVNAAPDFSDVKGAWCESYVETVCQAGLMEGRSDGSFNPSGELMPEHIVTICARLYDLLTGGDGVLPEPAEGQTWYDPAYEHLAESIDYRGAYDPSSGEYLGGGDGAQTQEERLNALRLHFTPGKYPVSRRSFLDLLSRTLAAAEADLPAINQITVVPDCVDPMVLSFYNAGVLTGSDQYGTFQGNDSLNRGQAAAMLARIINPGQRLTFTLQSFDLCRDVLGVAPDTPLLTVDGQPVTAELFTYQLCTSLLQWEGTADKALSDATRFWCDYYAPFQVLAEEKGVALFKEKLAEIAAEAQASAGLYGTTAAYQQFQEEGLALNLALRDLYIEQDWKMGEAYYHSDLEKVSDALYQKAVPTDALNALDLRAVYNRLKTSPFAAWRF
ncbi:MAG: S-layer homology domain-containing protein [Oscillospiraceae bacterium]|nr:S-layer homology domain-containing protein [Oscillospiraceae bacterium]